MEMQAHKAPETGLSEFRPKEQTCRIDLAACCRLIDLYGLSDLTSTHVSASIPGEEGVFLINPYPLFFDQVRASDLSKVSIDGRVVDDEVTQTNAAGINIHGAIHAARNDVGCVIHTHTVAGMAISSLDCRLLPMTQHALWFQGRVGYHEYEGIADDVDEQKRIVHDLGNNVALIMRNHGLLTVAHSIPTAFKMMVYLEKACQTQLAAMAAAGQDGLVLPSDETCDRTANQYRGYPDFGDKDWPGHLERLDRMDAGFRE